jgi:Uma2 family endonuclease
MLDHLPPEAPKHLDLIDGSLFIWPPRTDSHQLTIDLLADPAEGIRPPANFAVVIEMTVTLGLRQRPEPDVMVVLKSAARDLGRTSYTPDEVLLVVEVVSPASEEMDRTTKPIKYSEAGITYLWRVERHGHDPVVYTFELEPSTKTYVPTGIHRGRLKTHVGFGVDIDLKGISG